MTMPTDQIRDQDPLPFGIPSPDIIDDVLDDKPRRAPSIDDTGLPPVLQIIRKIIIGECEC